MTKASGSNTTLNKFERTQSSSSVPAVEYAHSSRRMFLGPMPMPTYTLPSQSSKEEDEEASDFVSQHGLRIFLQQGGRIEEWTDAKAHEYKERLKRNILESVAWHALSKSMRKGKSKKGILPTVEWKGNSFEIGKVVGVGINFIATMDDGHSQHSGEVSSLKSRSKSATTVHWYQENKSIHPTLGVDSKSSSSPGPQSRAARHLSVLTESTDDSKDSESRGNGSPSSQTQLLFNNGTSAGSPMIAPTASPGMQNALNDDALTGPSGSQKARNIKSILRTGGKGKGKVVEFAATPTGSRSPVPPNEVLNRTASEVEDSSAAAAAETMSSSPPESDFGEDDGPYVSRDRMLVRVLHCDSEHLNNPFTDRDCRITRDLDNKEWDEFLVIWRKHMIELYEDYNIPCKERYYKHKNLAFVIPLTMRTKLSIFSPIDLSFCLICPPTPTKASRSNHRSIFHRSVRGLNVFIFKSRSKSRAVDWVWNLWRQLGGRLPESFEVKCPLVHSRVNIPIPDRGEQWEHIGRDHIIDSCSDVLDNSFAWKTVIDLPVANGRRLELCWRFGLHLDWIWLHDDVNGDRRDWEVLYGLAMQSLGSPSQLELHLAGHYPTHIIRDTKRLEEPPSVEGYVYSYTGKTQTRVQYFLVTHDNLLFVIPHSRAQSPPIPTDLRAFSKSKEQVRDNELARLRMQMVNARGFYDMRDIAEVRRAIHHEPSHPRHASELRRDIPTINVTGVEHTNDEHAHLWRTGSDLEDEGGDHSLATAKDKARLKIHRSFEVVLRAGKIVRFEVHSSSVAIEWVAHLQALVDYWRQRLKDDTSTEMNHMRECDEVITVSSRNPHSDDPSPTLPKDTDGAALYANELWNWCILDGCRQILKSGRLFMKKKMRSQYKHVHLVLIRGCLIQFQLSKRLEKLNHQNSRINLIDAYVVSGYYAAMTLSVDEYDPNEPPTAKLYSDGLETRDTDEDTLFMLWYRPHNQYTQGDYDRIPIMQLSAKHSLLIFRARSKLERDLWCWALNCEIERLVRKTKKRETSMRMMGMPI